MNRTVYQKYRKEVRLNITIHSHVARRYRTVLNDVPVIMGGVVLKKLTSFSCLSGLSNDKVRISRKAFGQTGEGIPSFELTIFDFSGMVTIESFPEDDNKELRRELSRIEEGNIVYAIGKVIPINSEQGFFLLPSMICTSDSFEAYKMIYGDNIAQMKQTVKERTAQNHTEDDFDRAYYDACWNAFGVVRSFMKNEAGFEEPDYDLLSDAFYLYYEKHNQMHLKQLINKYYTRYYQSQYGLPAEHKQKCMLERYPALSE